MKFISNYNAIWTWGFQYLLVPVGKSKIEVLKSEYRGKDEIVFYFKGLNDKERKFLFQILNLEPIENYESSKLVMTEKVFRLFLSLFIHQVYKRAPELRGQQRVLCDLFFRVTLTPFSVKSSGVKMPPPTRVLLKYLNKLSKSWTGDDGLKSALADYFRPQYACYVDDGFYMEYRTLSSILDKHELMTLGPVNILPGVLAKYDEHQGTIWIKVDYEFLWKFALRINRYLSLEEVFLSKPDFVAEYDILLQHQWPATDEEIAL